MEILPITLLFIFLNSHFNYEFQHINQRKRDVNQSEHSFVLECRFVSIQTRIGVTLKC